MKLAACVVAMCLGVGCSGASVSGDDSGLEPLVGEWRGVLLSRGGELPFALRVDTEGREPPAVVINAGLEQSLAAVARQGAASYTLRFFDDADSVIVAKMSPNGEELSGYWRYEYEDSGPDDNGPFEIVTQMPFAATRSDKRRFQRNDPSLGVASPETVAALPQLNGEWEFRIADGSDSAVTGRIVQQDERVTTDVIGRGMEGIYRDGLLRLSAFDGYRALLLHARARPDGTLEGRLWVADREATRLTAVRVGPSR